MPRPRLIPVPCLALMLLGVTLCGCGPVGFSQQLVGRWVGVPETAAQRAERTPAKRVAAGAGAQATAADEVTASAEPVADGTLPPDEPPTDLEAFDVRVSLDLRIDGSVEMGIGNGSDQSLTGTWRVVSAEQDRAVVEIVAKRPAAAEAKAVEEKRRFAVRVLDDGDAFTLVEENADRGFGALYFRRQE